MSGTTVEERLEQLELALKTAILFNHNVASVLARRLAVGNESIANAIAQDFQQIKGKNYEAIDNTMHDSYVDALILVATGKA